MEAILYYPEVSETVMEFLDPISKKALSRTCKHFRKVYLRIYFPHGLRMKTLGVIVSETADGKCSTCHRHKTIYRLAFLAVDHCITYKNYCRAKACHTRDFETSMRMLVELLWADGLQNRYLLCSNATNYARRMAGIDCRLPTARQLLHDQIISELISLHSIEKDMEQIVESCALHAKSHMLVDNISSRCILVE